MTDNTDITTTTDLTVDQAWTLWEAAKSASAAALEVEHEALRTLAKAGGKTFKHEGQLYQIRERKDKDGVYVPFVCKLKRPTKEWLAEWRASKVAEEDAVIAEVVADSVATVEPAEAGEASTAPETTEEAVVEQEAAEETPTNGSSTMSGSAMFAPESTIVLE